MCNKYFVRQICARYKYFSRFYITLGCQQHALFTSHTQKENNIKCSGFTQRNLSRSSHRPAANLAQRQEKTNRKSHHLTYLSLDVCCFLWCGSGQDARVAEARPKQHSHHKEEKHASDGRNGRSQVGRQERTAGM